MKLYVAGPMTGMRHDNFPAFHAAASSLRARGHEVLNPAENFGGRRGLPLHVYLKRDLADVLTCDGVAVLSGWRRSLGALKEVLVAVAAGLPVYEADTLAHLDVAEREIVAALFVAGREAPACRST